MEVTCPACGARNRIPPSRAGEPARCGRCHRPLPSAAGAAAPITVTDDDFERVVLGARGPALVDCWADWCQPCHMLAPTVDALARDYAGRVLVAKLDVDASPMTAERYQVRSIPTLLLFRAGRLVDRVTGVQPRGAIEARLSPLLAASA